MRWLEEDSGNLSYSLGRVVSARAGMKLLFALTRERRREEDRGLQREYGAKALRRKN